MMMMIYFQPLRRFFVSNLVEPKYRRITLDAITYMGWSDGRNPIDWDEVVAMNPENRVKLSAKDFMQLRKVLMAAKLAT